VSKTLIPFSVADVSTLARALARRCGGTAFPPGHAEMLNLLAQTMGFRNYQALRASHLAKARLARPPEASAAIDYRLIEQLRRYFDDSGRLSRKPKKYSHLQACLWVLWARLPTRQCLHEREVNALIRAQETIGDHLLLRRELVDGGWLTRTADGGEYRRTERRMPPESLELLRLLPHAHDDEHPLFGSG